MSTTSTAPSKPAPSTPTRTTRTTSRSVLGRGSLGASLVFVLPLFLIYEIGVLRSPYTYNGVDLVTRWIFELVGSETKFVLFNLAIATLFTYVMIRLRERISLARGVLVVLESALYTALMIGGLIAAHNAFSIGLTTGDAVVASAGAGVHEELVFRLCLMGGSAWLLRACGIRHGAAVAFALVGSALVFSAAHHVGPGGEPWQLSPFLWRAFGGVYLGLIAYFRSFAHAAYTHFAYDVVVMTA